MEKKQETMMPSTKLLHIHNVSRIEDEIRASKWIVQPENAKRFQVFDYVRSLLFFFSKYAGGRHPKYTKPLHLLFISSIWKYNLFWMCSGFWVFLCMCISQSLLELHTFGWKIIQNHWQQENSKATDILPWQIHFFFHSSLYYSYATRTKMFTEIKNKIHEHQFMLSKSTTDSINFSDMGMCLCVNCHCLHFQICPSVFLPFTNNTNKIDVSLSDLICGKQWNMWNTRRRKKKCFQKKLKRITNRI